MPPEIPSARTLRPVDLLASSEAWGQGLHYWYGLWLTAGVALAAYPVNALFGYRSVGFLFLCALLLEGLFLSFGPLLLGAALSALTWNYLFIPPHFTFNISDPDDVLMITAFFLVAVSTGALTARIRRDQVMLAARGRRSELLFRLLNVMAWGRGKQPLREIAEMLKEVLRRDFMVFLAEPGGALAAGWDAGQAFPLWHRDLKAAHWALENKRACGWSTGQFPNADALYIPLVGDEEVVGLLVCRPQGLPAFTLEEDDLLQGACVQLALWLERQRLEARSHEASRLRESEALHQTLLSSVSHELRTPLTALLGSAAALQDEAAWQDPARRTALLGGLAEGGERLNRVIDNLLDMARLSSGMLSLKYDWQDPAELVTLTLGRLKGALAQHRVELHLQDPLPLVRIDYRLMEHALSNLLLNAVAYSPEGSVISVSAKVAGEDLEWSVRDQGPGVDAAALEHVFEKFYRAPGSPTGGLGLGLNIVQSLLRAHGGEARVRNAPEGGAEFTLSLPLAAVPPMAEEGVA